MAINKAITSCYSGQFTRAGFHFAPIVPCALPLKLKRYVKKEKK
jgi:hypothetical protein